MKNPLKGIVVPNVTPFKSNYEIDEEGLRENVRWLIASGVHGLIPCGSTGEYSLMSNDERKRVAEIVINEVNGRIAVFPGATAVRTQDAVMFTEHARDKGADGVMVSPSYYYSTTESELYEYYKAVAKVGLPVCLYNVPVTVKVDMQPAFIAKLGRELNIQYVKEASGFANRTHEIIRLSEGKMTVLNGWDDLTLEAFSTGAKGWISAPGNVIPKQCVELYEAAVERADFKSARELYYKMLPALNLIEGSGKFVQYVKAGVELVGHKAGPLRLPLLPITREERAAFQRSLAELGVKIV